MYQIVVLIGAALLVLLDQLTKYWAVCALANGGAVKLIPGLLEFTYVENPGVAWGLLENRRWLITVITVVMLAFVLVLLMAGHLKESRFLTVGGVLVLAGGAGNLVDRLANGYVVDFIHWYKWFDFPVFNVADICITIGALCILLYGFFTVNREKGGEEPNETSHTDSQPGTGGTAD